MPSNSYDLVVLGDDVAALTCAVLCARRGLRTVVLGDDRPTRYALGPHRLPLDPQPWPTIGGSAAERVLKELHAELALRRKLRETKIAAQVVAPDLRIDLGPDWIAKELEREAGAGPGREWLARWDRAVEVSRTLDPIVGGEHALPGVGFFERREVARLVERAHADAEAWWSDARRSPAGTLWGALAAVAMRHPEPSPLAIARAADAWRAGPALLRGDGDALRELLIEKLAGAGGELRAGQVDDVMVSWGKVTGLKLATGEDIGAAQVVASRAPRDLVALLGKRAPRRLIELGETMKLVGHRYTLNFVIDQAGLPEHMAPTIAAIASPDGPPVGDNAFAIHVGEPDEAGRVVCSAATIVPAADGDDPDDRRLASNCAAVRAALWQRLGEVMPFFERHLVLAHSPFEATPPQVPGGRGSYDVPRHLPARMAAIWTTVRSSDTSAVDVLTGSSAGYVTGLKHLTLTGDAVVSALGIEGALVSGWSAAKVACAIAGKKKDYLRDEVVGTASP